MSSLFSNATPAGAAMAQTPLARIFDVRQADGAAPPAGAPFGGGVPWARIATIAGGALRSGARAPAQQSGVATSDAYGSKTLG